MKKENQLDIIYCKGCKFCKVKHVNEHSTIYSCSKGNSIEIEKPELRCNKTCYSKRLTNKRKLATQK